MSETCTDNCTDCAQDCAHRKEDKTGFFESAHHLSYIKKVIGIVSGKGGVGKSLVTSLLAVEMNRRGYQTAILDADVTGPSIPKTFGITAKAYSDEDGIMPIRSRTGIDIMSINLLLPNDTDPVIWRGPLLANMVKQFWTDVIWSEIDFMFIDLPPGTGDVPLTVFQSIPVDAIIVVTSPQELVSMIVRKAVRMAEMMKIPILGLVENMSFYKCPDNDKEYAIFGESHIEEIAAQHQLKVLAKLPIDPKLAAACDRGMIELYHGNWLDALAMELEEMIAVEVAGSEVGENETEIKNNETENKTSQIKKVEEIKMLKIAVASEKAQVTEHFGHCVNFNLFEVENDEIVKQVSIPNPGHKPGFLPNFLNDLGVNVIISGGMGGGAIEIFNDKNIEVVVGATGDARTAVEAWTKGELKSTGSVCHEHMHQDECE